METIDKTFLEDSKNIINYYLSSLYFFQGDVLDKSTYNDEMQQTMTDELAAKISLIQMANMITTCYEVISMHKGESSLNIYLEYNIQNCQAYKKINWPADINEDEKIKYLRNFFAHANYEYISNEEIHIYNNFPIQVEGTITMQDMAELQQVYLYAYEYIKRNERNYIFVLEDDNRILKGLNYQNENLLEDLRKIKKIKADGTNSSFLRQAGELANNSIKGYKNPHLHSFYSGVITSSDLEKGLIKFLQKMELDSDYATDIIENGLENLSEEEVQKIYTFIKANRIRYNNVPPEVYLQEIVDYSVFSFSSSTMLDKNRYLNYFLKHQIESDITIPVETDDETVNKQMAYASNLIDLVYFCFGFIFENSTDEVKNILYRDFEIYPFKIKVMKDAKGKDILKDKYIIKEDQKGENDKKLYGTGTRDKNALANQIAKLEEQIKSKKKTIEGLKQYKPSQLEVNQRQLEALEKDLLEKKVYKDIIMYEGNEHVNQKHFFEHLRNAITHNFYEFDFSEALKERRMDLLKITFRDYNTQTDKKVNFEATIDARNLISLCKAFKSSIEKYIDRYDVVTKPKTM